MIHLGDITKISGYDAPVVDVITGGSPCQDLSVAGKRAGLAGERSGLFMEQMRIVKEMRERDRKLGRTAWAVRPRYMVWENVPGAFSSGDPKGSDFAAVIEEIVKVCEPGAVVSVPVPDGGWTKSGCYYAEDGSWSIAWRVHDAQFWGVPQRRKRIALVADFGGLSAPEILFERKGLRGDPAEGGAPREGSSAGAQSGAGNSEPILLESNQNHATVQINGISTALPASMGMGGGYVPMVAGAHPPAIVFGLDQQGGKGNASYTVGVAPTLASDSHGTPHGVCYGIDHVITTPAVFDGRGNGCGDISPTITGDHQNRVTDYTAVCVGNGQLNQMSMAEQANTLDTMHDAQAVLTFDKEMYNCGEKARCSPQARFDVVAPTVRADVHPGGVCTSSVRRLTPLECERLQGFPDGWTDIGEWTDAKGKKHKDADSPRYKALGNAIALPFWEYLARRICAQYERPVTMGSLFDGIGGFPLAFQAAGAIPVWASEIEEFPIAVTKKHFPEVDP